MSIAAKPQTIADNEQRGYDAGKVAERKRWWNGFTKNGTRKHWNYAFFQLGWNNDTYDPPDDFEFTIQYAYAMFHSSEMEDTKKALDFTNLGAAASDVFRSSKLKTIRTITVNENVTFNNWFVNCAELESITFEGTIGQDISFVDCPLLSADSIANVVEHLAAVSVKTTITINSAIDMSAYKSTIEGKGWTIVQ
ncbi:MAG: hypothetical protein IJ039_04970 [Clostridia bacterium]|nr:hypothetical protein [Clostridia bacterium]